MTGDLSKRKAIRRAEELILLLRDIRSCRISTDEDDVITEIHIVAESKDRSPKLIARDVEACLNAELGLNVDYRKIGVVIMDSSLGTEEDDGDVKVARYQGELREERTKDGAKKAYSPAWEEYGEKGAHEMNDEGKYELEFLEEDSRIRFKGMNLKVDKESVAVDVRLEKDGIHVAGTAGAVKQHKPFFKLIAKAALAAVSKLLDEKFHLCLSGIEQVRVSEREAIVVSVQVVDGRKVAFLSGSAFIGQDANETAALAVLDAINRPFGRWKSRRRIHYRIK